MPFSKTDGKTPKLIQVEPEAHRMAKVASMLSGEDMKSWVSRVIAQAAIGVQQDLGISSATGSRMYGDPPHVPPKKGGTAKKTVRNRR